MSDHSFKKLEQRPISPFRFDALNISQDFVGKDYDQQHLPEIASNNKRNVETPNSLTQIVGKQLFLNTGNSKDHIKSVTQILSQDCNNFSDQLAKLDKSDAFLNKNITDYVGEIATKRKHKLKTVYQQNLSKKCDIKRQSYNKKLRENMKDFPMNFIKQNKQQLQYSDNGKVAKKLERIKKLQQETVNLQNQNKFNEQEEFLHQSIEDILKINNPKMTQKTSPIIAREERISIVTQHQFQNIGKPIQQQQQRPRSQMNATRIKMENLNRPVKSALGSRKVANAQQNPRTIPRNMTNGKKSNYENPKISSATTKKFEFGHKNQSIQELNGGHLIFEENEKLGDGISYSPQNKKEGVTNLQIENIHENMPVICDQSVTTPPTMQQFKRVESVIFEGRQNLHQQRPASSKPYVKSINHNSLSKLITSFKIAKAQQSRQIRFGSTKLLTKAQKQYTYKHIKYVDSEENVYDRQLKNFSQSVERMNIVASEQNSEVHIQVAGSRKSVSHNRLENQSHVLDDNIVKELMDNRYNIKSLKSSSILGPVYDICGNQIYAAKFRKPKWACKNEAKHFFLEKEDSLDVENSRNNRIKMEDPFQRRPNDNSVFTHITDNDISKFIVGQSFLAKRNLDYFETIGVHPYIDNLTLFKSEILQTVGVPKVQKSKESANQMIADLEQQYEIFNVSDPLANLKDETWVADYHKDPVDIEFRKFWQPRIEGYKSLNLMLWQEMFNENSEDWKIKFDCRYYEGRCKRLNEKQPKVLQLRLKELAEWGVKFADYAKMEDLTPAISTEIVPFINKKLAIYAIENRPKKIIDPLKDLKDKNWILCGLRYFKFLKLTKPEFGDLQQPTQEEYDQNYVDTWEIDENTDRDFLQSKIVNHFKKINQFFVEYDLKDCSTFNIAFDQSDYPERKIFNYNIDRSLNIDMVKIINSEVYKKKQRNQIISLLDPRDFSILTKKCPGFLTQIAHPDLHLKLMKHNFNFQRQNKYFYQWYSDYIVKQASTKGDFNKYYKTKKLHETMLSRQKEAHWKKVMWLDSKHISYSGLMEYIYKPTFTKLTDSMIKDKVMFKRQFNFFMQQFDESCEMHSETWKVGQDMSTITNRFFLLRRDWTSDPGQKNIALKFDNTVYRVHNSCPEEEDPEHPRSYEFFTVTLEFDQHFQDKTSMHQVLAQALKQRRVTHYIRQKELVEHRFFEKQIQDEKHQEREKAARKAYLKTEKRKMRRRAMTERRMDDVKIKSGECHPYLDLIIDQQIPRIKRSNSPVEEWPEWKGMDNEDFEESSPRHYDEETQIIVDQIKEGIPELLQKYEFQRSEWISKMKEPCEFKANNVPAPLPRIWHQNKLSPNDLDIEGLAQNYLKHQDNNPRTKEKLQTPEVMFTTPYTPPEKPDLTHLDYEYLLPEIQKFEERYGLQKEQITTTRSQKISESQRSKSTGRLSKSDIYQKRKSLKKQRAINFKELITIEPEQHQEVACSCKETQVLIDAHECTWLKWIDANIGDQTVEQLFQTCQCSNIIMGKGIKEIRQLYNTFVKKKDKKEQMERAKLILKQLQEKQKLLQYKRQQQLIRQSTHRSVVSESESDVNSEILEPNFPKFRTFNHIQSEEEQLYWQQKRAQPKVTYIVKQALPIENKNSFHLQAEEYIKKQQRKLKLELAAFNKGNSLQSLKKPKK